MLDTLGDLNFSALNNNGAGVSFSVMNKAEIDELRVSEAEWGERTTGIEPKALIRHWYLISVSSKHWTRALLLGHHAENGTCWCTSMATAVAPDCSALITKSGSLYQLTDPAREKEEPGLMLTLHLVWTLRYWGLGAIVRQWPEVIA